MLKNISSEEIRELAYDAALSKWYYWRKFNEANPGNTYGKAEEDKWSEILKQVANFVF